MFDKLRPYYQLIKPGIIRGNALHVLAGALLASTYMIQWRTIGGVLVGTSLVIASACVANNYLDRTIDAKMKRTKKRPSVTGKVGIVAAMIYAAILLISGIAVLYIYTNLIVIGIGLLAYVLYVFAYGWAKRTTVHSTLIGAIPGALPAMAGYVAVDGTISTSAVLIFLLVLAWQMPHFYAISVFRRDDYRAADLPVLGAIKPISIVRNYILGYMLVYAIVITMMISTQSIGPPAGLLLIAGAMYWLYVFWTPNDDEKKWARSVFGASLLLALLLLLSTVLNILITYQA